MPQDHSLPTFCGKFHFCPKASQSSGQKQCRGHRTPRSCGEAMWVQSWWSRSLTPVMITPDTASGTGLHWAGLVHTGGSYSQIRRFCRWVTQVPWLSIRCSSVPVAPSDLGTKPYHHQPLLAPVTPRGCQAEGPWHWAPPRLHFSAAKVRF